jgi:hypothetical protein
MRLWLWVSCGRCGFHGCAAPYDVARCPRPHRDTEGPRKRSGRAGERQPMIANTHSPFPTTEEMIAATCGRKGLEHELDYRVCTPGPRIRLRWGEVRDGQIHRDARRPRCPQRPRTAVGPADLGRCVPGAHHRPRTARRTATSRPRTCSADGSFVRCSGVVTIDDAERLQLPAFPPAVGEHPGGPPIERLPRRAGAA